MRYTPTLVEKNYTWIWIAVDRYGKRFLSFVCGDRSTKTGLSLWGSIKNLNVNYFASDYWESYQEFIPAEKHLQSKAETFTVEGYNKQSNTTLLSQIQKKNKILQ